MLSFAFMLSKKGLLFLQDGRAGRGVMVLFQK